ncbi:MAG: TlpA family protein disulfide reductase [Candidatus Symbiothrix sp.]|nr:TlpA family protein disulfide reductase [Candidatus Symbiothrix sp.]
MKIMKKMKEMKEMRWMKIVGMKKLLFSLFSFSSIFSFLPFSFAQVGQYAEIRGRVQLENSVEVKLFAVENGAVQLMSTTQTGPNGSYGFLFVPATGGFYTMEINRREFLLYLQAGDKANLDILNDGRAVLIGDNTKENNELYKWQEASEVIRTKALVMDGNISTFEDFFPEFEELAEKTESIKQSINSGNPEFDNLLRTKMDYDMDEWFLSFLYSPRTKHPEKSDQIPYYNTILSEKKFASDDVLRFPGGIRTLRLYLMFNRMQNETANLPVSYDLTYISHPVLKSEYVLTVMKGLKSYDKYEEYTRLYGDYLLTPEQKKQAKVIGSKLYQATQGKAAADFSYPDPEGTVHSLSEYQGSVIVVDVWATWCGPCRKQFPFLKKLEKKLQGKDVVFIGISIDDEKDKQKWKSMIQSEALPGLQLFAGKKDSKITIDYKINAIPRYLVFDKKGNLVSDHAPRPDSSDLEEMLEKELAK